MTNASIINVIRNYWRFDHGQQHTHTWHDREDFIRDHLVPLAARIAELEAERDRLAAIVERLPRTADWVPVTPGMTLHHPDDITTYGGVIQVDDCITTVLIAVERQPDGLLGRCVEFSAADCYSTRELAEAAAKGDSLCSDTTLWP